MGAMENKASTPQRQIRPRFARDSTDDDYANIEGVIAHEYFF
jgi:aminopeptidase N